MQKNDLFVIDLKHTEQPEEPDEINFLSSENRDQLSMQLFRVQKFSEEKSGSFRAEFRHHLETGLKRSDLNLKGFTWARFTKNLDLSRLTKVQVNHLGQIVAINEVPVRP